MDPLVAGFWGVFVGTVALTLVGALLMYARTRRKVPMRMALLAVLSALFALAYLGGLPIADRETEQRVLAHVAVVCFALIVMMLLALLGVTRQREQRRQAIALLSVLAALVVLAGWALSPRGALELSSLVTILVGLAALVITGRSALRGNGVGWVAFVGVIFVEVALVGLSWIALDDVRTWPLHAISAIAGTCYLASFSTAAWFRYSYLLELREVMAHGPSYDPVTRMRSHTETGQLAGAVLGATASEPRPVGVIAISMGNLYALEQLHGRGAANHALFVCASRLRRCVPADVEMGRLGDDGFLLLARDSRDPVRLVALAREVTQQLSRPVSLNTSDPTSAATETGRASWVADVGVGVLATTTPTAQPANAVAMARAMSRTAWSFGSRIAWFDRETRQIAEMPLADATP